MCLVERLRWGESEAFGADPAVDTESSRPGSWFRNGIDCKVDVERML